MKAEEMHTTHLQLMQLLQLAITQFLFAALIAVVLHVTAGHQGMVKQLVVIMKMLYNIFINSAGSWRQHLAGHLNCPKYS